MEDQITLEPFGHPSNFAQLYEAGKLCDLTLRAVGREGITQDFNVHRVILAGASTYWENLLASEWPVEAGRAVVCVQTDLRGLAVLVRHSYGLAVAMSLETALIALNVADMFLMESLKLRLRLKIIRSNPSFEANEILFLRIAINHAQHQREVSYAPENLPEKRQRVETPAGNSMYDPLLICDDVLPNYFWNKTVERAHVLILNDSHLPLLPLAFIRFFLADSFVNAQEIDLFRFAAKWAKATNTPFGDIAESIRYPLMTLEELYEVEESDLVDPKMLLCVHRVREVGLRQEGMYHGPSQWMTPRMCKTVSLELPDDVFENGREEKFQSDVFEMCTLKWKLHLDKVLNDGKLCFRFALSLVPGASACVHHKEHSVRLVVTVGYLSPDKTERVYISKLEDKTWATQFWGPSTPKAGMYCKHRFSTEELQDWVDGSGNITLSVGMVARVTECN